MEDEEEEEEEESLLLRPPDSLSLWRDFLSGVKEENKDRKVEKPQTIVSDQDKQPEKT